MNSFYQNKPKYIDSSHNRSNRYLQQQEEIEEDGETASQKDIDFVDNEIIQELKFLYNDDEVIWKTQKFENKKMKESNTKMKDKLDWRRNKVQELSVKVFHRQI